LTANNRCRPANNCHSRPLLLSFPALTLTLNRTRRQLRRHRTRSGCESFRSCRPWHRGFLCSCFWESASPVRAFPGRGPRRLVVCRRLSWTRGAFQSAQGLSHERILPAEHHASGCRRRGMLDSPLSGVPPHIPGIIGTSSVWQGVEETNGKKSCFLGGSGEQWRWSDGDRVVDGEKSVRLVGFFRPCRRWPLKGQATAQHRDSWLKASLCARDEEPGYPCL
jgi:hypothetical protein